MLEMTLHKYHTIEKRPQKHAFEAPTFAPILHL